MSVMVWRWKLSDIMIGILTINLLKFQASIITINLTMVVIRGPYAILAFTNSSSTLEWLYKASFPVYVST